MTSVTQSGTRSSGKLVGAVILAIIGILAIIVGLIYVVEPAGSLPSFLGHEAGSTGHRPLHIVGAFAVGVVLVAFAGWVAFGRKAGGATERH